MKHSITTEYVRRHFANGPVAYYEDGTPVLDAKPNPEYAGALFDQWLAEHDREVADAAAAISDRPETARDVAEYLEIMEDEARAEAERINAWADEALGHGDLSAFGVDDESFIAGALWHAERVIRTKNLFRPLSDEIRRYADDRRAHGPRATVSSWRIASDLYQMLGLNWPQDDRKD